MKKPIGKVALYYGLIMSLSLIVYDVILGIADLRQEKVLGMIVYVIIGAFVVLAIRKQRDAYQQGQISYKNALGVGVATVAIGAIVASIYQYVHFVFIDPSEIKEMLELSQQELIKRGLSDREIDQAIQMSRKMMTPGVLSFIALFSTVFLGTIVSLVAAAFLKKEVPQFDDVDIFENDSDNSNQ